MKTRLILLLTLGSIACADAAALAQRRRPRFADQQAARNGWIFDLESGKARARETGKPLMVVLRCVP
jgi:hypothetical protein